MLRVHYLHRPPYGPDEIAKADREWDEVVGPSTPISEMYDLLSDQQKLDYKRSTESPAVRMHTDSGRDPLNEGPWDLLRRLEAGEWVGPADEKQIQRKAGDRAFLP